MDQVSDCSLQIRRHQVSIEVLAVLLLSSSIYSQQQIKMLRSIPYHSFLQLSLCGPIPRPASTNTQAFRHKAKRSCAMMPKVSISTWRDKSRTCQRIIRVRWTDTDLSLGGRLLDHEEFGRLPIAKQNQRACCSCRQLYPSAEAINNFWTSRATRAPPIAFPTSRAI